LYERVHLIEKRFEMKKKIIITWVLVIAFVLCVVPAWAAPDNPLAEAAYKARMAEGDNNKSAANAIKKAVIDDPRGNPAQSAYDARIKENEKLKTGKFDSSKKDNPADKIYQAVINEQKKLLNDANTLADKFKSKEASEALDTLETFLGRIPECKLTKPAKGLEKAVNIYQLVKTYKTIVDKTIEAKTAPGFRKDMLNREITDLSLDYIGKIGSMAFGPFRSNLLSSVIDGAKGIIAAKKKEYENLDLILYGLHDYTPRGDNYEFRDIALVMMKNGESAADIDATVDAIRFINRMR
jgi:hypothetical protein